MDARAGTRNATRKTDLTLSAVPAPDLELARDQAYIERELGRIDRIRALGFGRLADRYLDRLVDAIIAPRPMCVWPDDLTESEARLMDGNR